MKEYLKMSDGFDADEAAIEQRLFSGLICKEEATYAAHAIASHDELVEMNKEILDCLESFLMASVVSISASDYHAEFDKANSLLAKYKGGSA